MTSVKVNAVSGSSDVTSPALLVSGAEVGSGSVELVPGGVDVIVVEGTGVEGTGVGVEGAGVDGVGV